MIAAPTPGLQFAGGGLGYWLGKQAEQLLSNYAKNQPQQISSLPELASQGIESATVGMMPLAAGAAINSTLSSLAPKLKVLQRNFILVQYECLFLINGLKSEGKKEQRWLKKRLVKG